MSSPNHLTREDLISFPLNTHQFINNPYPTYSHIQSIHPVYWNAKRKYRGWFITGYNEAKTALKDSRLENRIPLPVMTKKYQHLRKLLTNMLLYKNQMDHIRIRKIVSKAFSPRRISYYQPYIKNTVHELLEDCTKQRKKTIDIISDFAFPLTSLVIAKLLGIPEKERHHFRKWAIQLVKTIDLSRSKVDIQKGEYLIERLMKYFQHLIHEKTNNPDHDLISLLIKDEQLTEEELIATCILLVIAGHETTVNLICNSVYSLLKHPDQLLKLQENPNLIDTAIEEFLRYESPTQLTARIASEDMELGGKSIKSGEHIYILLGAANRDPNTFYIPDTLDITRKPNPHLSFGHGAHFCIGASLARMEAKIALLALIQQKPNIKLQSDNIQWRRLIGFRALAKLPVIVD
ncbi:MAG TPA: cytochrome P450 [Virgibacillus sp.]|nr:cytochrome P450 [Virgibacillus sp.]HLR69516.1 cytochrome P450 [Virgibacillus sp.]